jgi:hypothetical protein
MTTAAPTRSQPPPGTTPLHPELEMLLEFLREARADSTGPFWHRAGLIPNPTFFSVASLQRHLNNPLLHPDWAALVYRGQVIPLQQACFYKIVQAKKLLFIDKRFLDDYLARGASVVLEGLDLLDPAINAFLAQVDAALPCALANAVAFFSQRGSEAYRGHVDQDDVLVIHVAGEKTWRLFAQQPPRRVNMNELTPEQMGRQIAEITLRPGDALYMRSCTPHICETPGSHSLHLSFDLADRTPTIESQLDAALGRYRQASCSSYSPAGDVAQAFASILTSEEFAAEAKRRTEALRTEARAFRDRIGGASGVRSLSRFGSE